MVKKRPELLLQQPIPKPLHGLTPRSIIGSTRWNNEKEIMRVRTKERCEACGRKSKDGLEAHECYEVDYKKCTMIFTEVVGLCWRCHGFIHSGFIQSQVAKKLMTFSEMSEIVARGFKILSKAGLYRTHDYPSMFDWSKWRLIYDGKEYKSKFKNYEAWAKRYS